MKLPPELAAQILATPGVLVDGKPVGESPKRERPAELPRETEAEFMQRVIDLARSLGWKVAHFRGVRVQRADGSTYWQTPVQADGAGWPDLFLVRKKKALALETKIRPNKPTPEQEAWLAALSLIPGVTAAVVYPEDWDEIETILRGKP